MLLSVPSPGRRKRERQTSRSANGVRITPHQRFRRTLTKNRHNATWAAEWASWRLHKGMLTLHEFLAKNAMVLPNLFRIQPFVGLAQPISLKPKLKRRSRLRSVEKRVRVR